MLGLTGSSAQVSQGCRQGVTWAVFSSVGSAREGSTFKLAPVVGIHSLAAVRLRAVRVSSWVSVVPTSALGLPDGLLHRQFTTWQLAYSRPAGERERVCKQRECYIKFHKCNYRSDVWHLCCILLVGSQSQLPPTLKERGSHKG